VSAAAAVAAAQRQLSSPLQGIRAPGQYPYQKCGGRWATHHIARTGCWPGPWRPLAPSTKRQSRHVPSSAIP